MSELNLFTTERDTEETPMNMEDAFFEKLEAMEVDYSVLGEDVVSTIEYWSQSFSELQQYNKTLKEFKEKYWADAKENRKHYFEDFNVPGMVEAKKTMRSNVLTLFRQQFNIQPPEEVLEVLKIEDFDFGDKNAILDLLMKHTNNGDTSSIERDQKLKEFSKYVYRNPNQAEHKMTKKKITVNRAFSSSKCNILNRYCLSPGRYEIIEAWRGVFDFFSKNLGETDTGFHLIDYLWRNGDERDGIYEDRVDNDSDLITAVKIMKNGNMVLTFKTEELARKFWDEWLMPAQEK